MEEVSEYLTIDDNATHSPQAPSVLPGDAHALAETELPSQGVVQHVLQPEHETTEEHDRVTTINFNPLMMENESDLAERPTVNTPGGVSHVLLNLEGGEGGIGRLRSVRKDRRTSIDTVLVVILCVVSLKYSNG